MAPTQYLRADMRVGPLARMAGWSDDLVSVRLRDISATVLIVAAVALLLLAVTELRARDYVASLVLVLAGLAVMRGGVDLMGPPRG